MTETITQWTTLLNEGAVGAVATMPTIAAGSNRRALIAIFPYNGGGNCQPPASITVNGIVRNQSAGDTVPRDRTSIGVYEFTESEMATISGQSIASTASGSQKTIMYKLLGNATQGAITQASAYSATTATLTMGLARVADSQTELIGFSSTTGQILTSANPANDGNVSLTSGRRVSWAEQTEAAGATADTTVNGNSRTSAVVLNIGQSSSAQITAVNSGGSVIYGAPFTWATSGFSPAPNAATIAGVACSSVSGSGGTAPALNDGATVPMPGTRQLTGSNGTQSANINKVVAVADGLFARELIGTPDTGAGSVVVGFDPAAKAGDYLVYPTANNTSISDKAILETDNVGTMNCVHISVDAGNPNQGTAYLYKILTGPKNDRGISLPLVQPLTKNLSRGIV